jgi:type II pantothenate kinase
MRRVTRKQDEIYPFLLVNIGSGVSILEVRTCFDFDRVTGSALGGATYWGLCKVSVTIAAFLRNHNLLIMPLLFEFPPQLLTSFKSFDESMEAAGSGAVNRVNLSVGDIYGGDYANVGLPANVTAAFFGKATRADDPRDEIVDADIAKSLIQMIAQNVTHIAFMVAHMRSVA